MSAVEPVDPRGSLAITQWTPDAPRGAVTTFCSEHGISRETFYAIKRRAAAEGQAAALEPRTRRPRSSPNRTDDAVKQRAIGVRAALEQSGLDHGPISVHEKMKALGMISVPSTASLSRIFRDAGSLGSSRGRNREPRSVGLFIRRRTRAGNSTAPNTSSPVVANA